MRFRVAGVTHATGYPDNLLRLREAVDAAHDRGEPLVALLVRDPDNPHDPNAVQVHVPSIGQVGFVPKDCGVYFHYLEAGVDLTASVEYVAIKTGHEYRPGIEIRVSLTDRNG